MKTATLPITGGWYAVGGSATFEESETLYSGRGTGSDGSTYNYRSKVAISTDGLKISKSNKLVVAVQVSQLSSPIGCMGVLTQKNITTPSDVQNADATGASEELLDGALATSYAYKDAEGAELAETNQTANSYFYFIFDTKAIKAGQTYYIYLIRTHSNGYTGTGFCATKTSLISPLLYYSYAGLGYIHDGTESKPHAAYIHNGTEYKRHITYKHNGTEWKPLK